ncbi:MAG: thiamine diphosphokinase [Christensenellaceae bacterium]|nr:thiamine diphosphokinase [Christensenellaceae bacterium]
MKICHIVGAGEFNPCSFKPCKDDYVIAADAGYGYCESLGITPHLVMGDFDSLGELPKHGNVIQHPVMKDDTDTMLAVKKALEMGYECIMLHGCTGGRQDHTLANLQALYYIAKSGAVGFMFGTDYIASCISAGSMKFDRSCKGNVSVFCMGERALGVCIKGLKYEACNIEMTPDNPVGVSNEFVGKESLISVKSGVLTVLWSDMLSALPTIEKSC